MNATLKKANQWLLATMCCFSLVLGLQAIGMAAVQQTQLLVVDEAVVPAGCTDTCCGDDTCDGDSCGNTCCGSDSCSNNCCEAACCPKKVETEVKKHCWKVSTKQVCIPGFTFKLNGLEFNLSRPRCNKSGCDQLGCTDCSTDTCCGCCDGGCADGCCTVGCCGNGQCSEKCDSNCCDCPPKCGRVRCVKVLEKHEYTCDKCGYEWEVKCVRSNKGLDKGCSRKRCGCPSCGAKSQGCCASTQSTDTKIELTSATEEITEEETTKEITETNKRPSLAYRMMSLLKK